MLMLALIALGAAITVKQAAQSISGWLHCQLLQQGPWLAEHIQIFKKNPFLDWYVVRQKCWAYIRRMVLSSSKYRSRTRKQNQMIANCKGEKHLQ